MTLDMGSYLVTFFAYDNDAAAGQELMLYGSSTKRLASVTNVDGLEVQAYSTPSLV